jgi:hypothetical protein
VLFIFSNHNLAGRKAGNKHELCTMSTKSTLSEYKIDSKWDACMENFLIKFGLGVAGGAVAGALFTREWPFSFSVQPQPSDYDLLQEQVQEELQ